jgi:integrase
MARPQSFGNLVERYIGKIQTYPRKPSDATVREKTLKLERLGRIFGQLHQNQMIRTTNIMEIGEKDLEEFCRFLMARDWSNVYRNRMVAILEEFATFYGNTSVTQARKVGLLKFQRLKKHKRFLGQDWLKDAISKLETLGDSWPVEVTRFVVQATYWGGFRPKELREQELRDVDTVNWRLEISSEKAKTEGGLIGVLEEARTAWLDFLAARDRMLRSVGLDPQQVVPLIPKIFSRKLIKDEYSGIVRPHETLSGGFYNCEEWNSMRWKVFHKAGIKSPDGFRILRPSFAKEIVGDFPKGERIEGLKRALRHKYTSTTEQFYYELENVGVWDEISKVRESRRLTQVKKVD